MVVSGPSESLRFSERVSRLLERVDYRLASHPEDREEVFRLRYGAYLREGAIDPHFSKRFADDFDEQPNARTYGIYVDGRLASSMRLHVATAEMPYMPALRPFPDMLEPELKTGKVIVDPTRFVTDWECSRLYPELPYATVRLAWAAAEHYEADLLLATVRVEHQAFYRRVFGHQILCEARPYPNLKKPLSLMAVDFAARRETVQHRYPFFHSTAFERRMLFGPVERRDRRRAAAA